jgi:transcriptional regulator with XRE-family HTH domain
MGRSGNGDHARRDADIHLGLKLRTARLDRGLSMEQVAERAGLTKSFISRLERDEVAPSIASLVAVCDALSLRVGDLFDPPATSLVRAGEASPVQFGPDGLVEYQLTPNTQRQVTIYLSVAEPGVVSSDELYTHPSDVETVYVLRGRIEVVFAATSVTVSAGDAFTFAPREPHRWRNASDTEPCSLLWVFAPAL